MFDCCCSPWSQKMKDKLDYKVENTEKGIRIDMVPKDPDKRETLQNLIQVCKEFCGTERGSCC